MWRKIGFASAALLLALMTLSGFSVDAAAQDDDAPVGIAPDGTCFTLTTTTSLGVAATNYTPADPGSQFANLIPEDCNDGEEDEVLGIVETPDDVLAFTGSSVNTPVTIGFSLLGAGGLALYAARRRADQDEQAQLAKEFDELELV